MQNVILICAHSVSVDYRTRKSWNHSQSVLLTLQSVKEMCHRLINAAPRDNGCWLTTPKEADFWTSVMLVITSLCNYILWGTIVCFKVNHCLAKYCCNGQGIYPETIAFPDLILVYTRQFPYSVTSCLRNEFLLSVQVNISLQQNMFFLDSLSANCDIVFFWVLKRMNVP